MKNKKNTLINIIFLIAFTLFNSCKYGSDNLFYTGASVNERTKDGITFLEDNPVQGKLKYNVLIFSDTHFGVKTKTPPYQKLYEYLDKIKETSEYPAFAIALGDLTDTAGVEEFEQYNVFIQTLENKYNLKTYNIIGNHDCYLSGWDNWKNNCYPHTSFYKFETSNFSYYFLDTGTGTIGKNQLNHLKKEMQKDSKQKVICSHYPLYTSTLLFCMGDSYERNELINLFQRTNVKIVLSGHIHKNETVDLGTFAQQTITSFTYYQKIGILKVDEDNKKVDFEKIDLK